MEALITYAETDTTPRFTWQATAVDPADLARWQDSIRARMDTDAMEDMGLAVSPDPDQVLAEMPRQVQLPGAAYSLDAKDWPEGTFFYFGTHEVGVRRPGERELCYVEARD